MLFGVSVFGPPIGQIFPKIDEQKGSYAEFDSFDAITGDVQEQALHYEVLGEVSPNGYRLGEHRAPNYPSVLVQASGNRVAVSAPTLIEAKSAWNDHLAGIDQWLQAHLRSQASQPISVRITVHGPAGTEALTEFLADGTACATFDDFEMVPAHLAGANNLTFVVTSPTLPNHFMIGGFRVSEEPRAGHYGTVSSNGLSLRVQSHNLLFAMRVVYVFLGAIGKDSVYATEARDELLQLRRNGRMS
ncbi:MAG TPA: hypothetical protein VFO38_06435 [Candidatus Saccharimonadales bacterium]|nr:hypothetical protein [Candidatus Saccharimonadales bacterium]